ncbi:hypothetical protein CW304_26340 [Bacillus sp. UFRGS-B20]|nr:hypothetical protein CW304_26340 [Bacillus sp. UFRGS-B20]
MFRISKLPLRLRIPLCSSFTIRYTVKISHRFLICFARPFTTSYGTEFGYCIVVLHFQRSRLIFLTGFGFAGQPIGFPYYNSPLRHHCTFFFPVFCLGQSVLLQRGHPIIKDVFCSCFCFLRFIETKIPSTRSSISKRARQSSAAQLLISR